MRRWLPVTLFLLAGCSGGSKSSPTAPSTPPTPTWNVTGFVRSAVGGNIIGATVRILDGPDAGKEATTDANAFYGFSGLQQAGFTLSASANGYQTTTQAVTLTSNQLLDFRLARTPVAALTFEGDLLFQFRAGAWDVSGTAVNTGDGCATAISGTTTLSKGADGITFSWAMPTTQVVRPGERFTYAIGTASVADIDRLNGGTYRSSANFSSISCP